MELGNLTSFYTIHETPLHYNNCPINNNSNNNNNCNSISPFIRGKGKRKGERRLV